MRISWFLVTTIVASLSLGCDGLSAGADERGDGIYDSFMGALTAEYGVSEGDTVTTGVLHLVNTASFETLDIDAALNARAAKNIIAHRQGADGQDGTDDDDLFETLTELDAIPYVGPVALDRLISYAWEAAAVAAGAADTDAADALEINDDPDHVQAVATALLLQVANTASFETLDIDAGLNKLAAQAIVAYRAGDDGIEGTDDDQTIESIDALDAISYVGPHALNRLRNYVFDAGLVDEALTAEAIEAAAAAAAEAALPEQALLEFVNHGTVEEFDIYAGIDHRAAENIVTHRAGPDGVNGNDDDGWFGSIEDVDAIGWVGQSALDKLTDYAMQLGYAPPTWTEGWAADRYRVRFNLPLKYTWMTTNPPNGYQRTIMVCDVNIRTDRVLCRRSYAMNYTCGPYFYGCNQICEATPEEFEDFENGGFTPTGLYNYPGYYGCYSCWDPESPDCTSPCTPALSGDIDADGVVTFAYVKTSGYSTYEEQLDLRFDVGGFVEMESYYYRNEYNQPTSYGPAWSKREWWICGDKILSPFSVTPR